ncbi:hypothetical protein D3C76_1740520 [compost metagenome]
MNELPVSNNQNLVCPILVSLPAMDLHIRTAVCHQTNADHGRPWQSVQAPNQAVHLFQPDVVYPLNTLNP